MSLTVADIIDYAKLCQYISSNAIENGGLYGGGEDVLLPRKLYCVRKNVEWMYDLDPSDTTLFETSRYLYALCNKYIFKAKSVVNHGGSVSPVIPSDSDCTGLVKITSPDFEADGKTVYRPDWDGKAIQMFWNNVNKFILPPEWEYVAGGGFKILQPTDFDASSNNSDVVMMVFVGCFNPGALFIPVAFPINEYLIYPAGTSDPFIFNWTAYYQNKYGVGAFSVGLDYGDGVFQPSAIQPIADNETTPTTYTFSGMGGLRFKITFS